MSPLRRLGAAIGIGVLVAALVGVVFMLKPDVVNYYADEGAIAACILAAAVGSALAVFCLLPSRGRPV
jgi:hypothetical protein